MQIEVRYEDLLTFEGDGMLVPTISSGLMQAPIAARVRVRAGEAIEAQVASHAPIAVGACLVTDGGGLPVRFLVHAPVVEELGLRMGVENIRRAVRASLLGATRYEISTLAIPGFGYDDAGVSHEECARAIIDEVTGYRGSHPQLVVLMDADEDMNEAFTLQLHNR